MASDLERDIFEGSMEPEFMCVGLSPESPNKDSPKAKDMDEPISSSILTRRKAGIRRGMVPLMIPIKNTPDDTDGIPGSSSKTTDSGFVDVELAQNSLERRSWQLNSTNSVEEDVFENDDSEHTTGSLSLPIEIPHPLPSARSHGHSVETPGLRGSFPYRSMDSSWFPSRMAISGSPQSLSLTLYQWSKNTSSFEIPEERPRSLAQVSRRASESHLLRRSLPNSLGQQPQHSRMRSASGSRIPSPSRSVSTQTPTRKLQFVFPDSFDSVDDNVTEYRLTARVITTSVGSSVPETGSRDHGIEGVGEQLRSIADDYQRSGFFRMRSQSLVQLFRRRSSAP